ncbi:MAG: Sec-independent protein translocase protein TatB [Steroidobacteraceae bacterium]
MFEVGFSEIVLILGLALLVLGPEKLPGLAEKVGRWTGRARAMARQLRAQLEQEVTIEEMAKARPMHAPKSEPDPATPSPTPASPEPTVHAEPVHPEFDVEAFSGHQSSTPAPPPVEPVIAPASDPVQTKITQ